MKIKICGIQTLPDALAAIDAGADLLGFNFYPKSPRYIDIETCKQITTTLKRDYAQVELIGVFVNMPVEQIRTTLAECALDLAQLHGDETPEMVQALEGKAFKAVRLSANQQGQAEVGADGGAEKRMAEVGTDGETEKRMVEVGTDGGTEKRMAEMDGFVKAAGQGRAPALLVDAAVKGVYGGSGVVADWSAAAELSKRFPLLLAGGLTPENVAEAVRQVQPWGVDTASGVECSPGTKDPEKMRAFVAAVRTVDLAGGESISIQKAEFNDLEAILALQKLAYRSEAKLNNDYSIPPLTQTLDEIRAEFEQALFLKAVRAGQIIGSVRGRLEGETCHIGRVIVHPERQNQGLGSRLLHAIETQMGARRFELFTSQRSERNLYLYQKFGYREFKRVALNERVTLIFLEKFNDNHTA